MIAPITSTRITSRSVNPTWRSAEPGRPRESGGPVGLIRDIPVLALAAFLVVGAERDEVVGLALAGHGVAVIVTPRVLQVDVLRVGPVPLVDARGLLHQRLQAVGVAPHLELV